MPKSNHHKYLILGAGMAGLGVGVALQQAGEDSLILEKDTGPGGLCRNQEINGCDFDYGPKILLLDDSENSKEILSFLDGNYEKYPVVESVYLSKYGLLGFPLQRHLIDLPASERTKILRDFDKAHQHPRKVRSLKDWLRNAYGEYFCKLTLYPYEEKKWQASLDKMDYQWALNRPINVDKEEVAKGATVHLPPNRWYYYPKRGNITTLSAAVARKAGPIEFNKNVTAINLKEKFVVASGQRYFYDFLISTLPLDYAIGITSPFPAALKRKSSTLLQRLGIVVINLVFKGNYALKGTALYFPEKKFIFRRVSILQNLCPALARNGYTPISVEISINPKKGINVSGVLAKVLRGFSQIDQFTQLGKPIAHDILEIGFAYPLQMNGLSELVAQIHDYYAAYGVYHCGRGGRFDYCNSDQAYKQGKETVKTLLNATGNINHQWINNQKRSG